MVALGPEGLPFEVLYFSEVSTPRPDGLSLESLVEAYNKMLSLSNGFSSI